MPFSHHQASITYKSLLNRLDGPNCKIWPPQNKYQYQYPPSVNRASTDMEKWKNCTTAGSHTHPAITRYPSQRPIMSASSMSGSPSTSALPPTRLPPPLVHRRPHQSWTWAVSLRYPSANHHRITSYLNRGGLLGGLDQWRVNNLFGVWGQVM